MLRSSLSVDPLTQCYVLIHVLCSVELCELNGIIEAARGYCGELGAADHSESTARTIVVHWGCAQRTMESRTRLMETGEAMK